MKPETKIILRDILIAIITTMLITLVIWVGSSPRRIPICQEPEYIPYEIPESDAYRDFLD